MTASFQILSILSFIYHSDIWRCWRRSKIAHGNKTFVEFTVLIAVIIKIDILPDYTASRPRNWRHSSWCVRLFAIRKLVSSFAPRRHSHNPKDSPCGICGGRSLRLRLVSYQSTNVLGSSSGAGTRIPSEPGYNWPIWGYSTEGFHLIMLLQKKKKKKKKLK
jgi:hypothetical protein